MSELRDRIAAALFRRRWDLISWEDETEVCREMWRRDADAVIAALEEDRDELVKEAIRDLQEKYILVPKSQTAAGMEPPRLVINRDCTPLKLPDEMEGHR